MTACQRTRRLWQNDGENDQLDQAHSNAESFEDLLARFSFKPPPRPLWDLMRGSLVVGQEFALTCLLLAKHRSVMEHDGHPDQWQQLLPMAVLPLILVLLFAEQTSTPWERTRDALLLSGMLRLVSSILRTLTVSYSSDTVYALAIVGMMLHLLACDYRYANGHSRKKTAGIVSLNASLFSTTLLASRLSSNSTVYVFVSSSVVLFAFYPTARHTIAVTQSHASLAFLVINGAVSFATWVLLETLQEKLLFVGVSFAICVVAPCWEYAVLQQNKVLLSGPWDIAHIVQEDYS